jgi:hypothetical protein
MSVIAVFKDNVYKIEQDLPDVGVYLYVFNEQGKCIKDFLQSSEEAAKHFAFEEFDVPINLMEE